MAFKVPEKYRDLRYSNPEHGNNGAFFIPHASANKRLTIIASDGGFWEHVSVSKQYECPTWDEMCMVKELFWNDPEDFAIQYHPPKSKYVNNHDYCLHLWRPMLSDVPFPPDIYVGIK
jgi:hypothetical protein